MESSKDSIYDIVIRLLLLLALIAWCILIIYPFANILLWSLILSIALYPIHNGLAKKLGEKPKLASFIIVFTILLVFILPAGVLISSLIDEVKELKVAYDNGTLAIPPPNESIKGWPIIGETLYDTWFAAHTNIENLIIKYKDKILDFAGKLAAGILDAANGVVQMILSVIIAGVILAVSGAGISVRSFLKKAAGERGEEFADIIIKTVRSVANGVIGEAFVIALLNGILFLLAGVPFAGLWALLVFVLAVLQMPLIIVTLPVMIYFFAEKETVTAILWTISLLLVSFSDNILTPLMLGKNAPVPMPVIFIGVIGGVLLSGFIGLFSGAIVMSLGYTLLIGWIKLNDAESLPE